MRIVVVGASGFIGRAFVDVADRAGHVVVAGVRDPVRGLFAPGVEVVRIEATDVATLEATFVGADRVIDCVMAGPSTMVAAARAISAAALRSGIERIVQLSSIAVYGATSGLVDEDGPRAAIDPYGRAKIQCEEIYAEARDKGVEVVVLRPALVFGLGSPLWATRIARLLRARRLGDLGEMGDGFCNLVHVRDVSAAMLASTEHETLAHYVYTLAPAVPPTWNRFLMSFAKALGATPVVRITRRRMEFEQFFAAPILRVGEIFARRVGLADFVPPPITPGLSRLFCTRVRFDVRRMGELVGSARATAWNDAIDEIARTMGRRPTSDRAE